MENFGFALLPKIPSDLPLPVTRRRSARLSRSANGTPPPGPSVLTNTRPPLNARSSCLRFSKGEPGVVVAAFKSAVIALLAAAKTAGTTEAVAQDAELNRIDLELISQLVHGRLSRIESGHSTRTAHVGWCADVAACASEMHPKIGHAVMERCRFTTILMIIIEH